MVERKESGIPPVETKESEPKEKWHVFGLGGLIRVKAGSEEEARAVAAKRGVAQISWATKAEDSSFKDEGREGEYVES